MPAYTQPQKGVSDDDQTTLSTYAQFAAERAEKHDLPRTEPCNCNRIHCFHNIDYERLNEETVDIEVEEELNL